MRLYCNCVVKHFNLTSERLNDAHVGLVLDFFLKEVFFSNPVCTWCIQVRSEWWKWSCGQNLVFDCCGSFQKLNEMCMFGMHWCSGVWLLYCACYQSLPHQNSAPFPVWKAKPKEQMVVMKQRKSDETTRSFDEWMTREKCMVFIEALP